MYIKRWNIEEENGRIKVCYGDHGRHESCYYFFLSPEEIIQTFKFAQKYIPSSITILDNDNVWDMKYCKKHNQRYDKGLKNCPICEGEKMSGTLIKRIGPYKVLTDIEKTEQELQVCRKG